MVKEEVKEEEKFVLPNEKVTIKPNFENPGWIKNPKHRAFFMLEGTYKAYMAPRLRSGVIKDVLTKAEKDHLEKIMNMEDNELSVYRKDNNFWESYIVKCTKDPIILDLSKPMDYISYKVLLANSDQIAPSVKNIKDKATYKFYIERQKEVDEVKTTKANTEKDAWLLYSKVEKDAKSLARVLNVYGHAYSSYGNLKSVSAKDNDIEFLRAKLSDIVANDKELFIETVKDPLFETKALLSEALKAGVIKTKVNKYYLDGEDKHFADSFKKAADFLDNPANQEFQLIVESKLKLNE